MTPDLVTCNMAIGQAGSTQFLTRIDYDPATESVPLPAQLCLLYWDLSFDATAYAHDWTCLTQPSPRANLSLTGTVTVAAGSMDTVTGTDTLFTSELVEGHDYTWRIDPNHADGGTTTGDTWTFSTIAAEPEPNEPEPEPDPVEDWQKTRPWRRSGGWIKRQTGLEGWRKR